MSTPLGPVPFRTPLLGAGGLLDRFWQTWFIGVQGTVARVDQQILTGTGSPVAVVVADVGTLYLRTDGTPGQTLYVKEVGTGTSAGWAPK